MRSITVSLLVAGALVLAGCGGGKSSSTTTAATTTTTTTTASTTTAVTTTTATTTEAAAPVTIAVEIKDGKPVGGIQRATAKKGDRVSLVVTSDTAEDVHIHGYDLIADVVAGGRVRITFKADLTGVFEAELEGRGLPIAELTVE